MKFLLPILMVVLVAFGALALWKFGPGLNNKPALQSAAQPVTDNAISKQIPVSGNPDDINATINQAAQDEGSAVTSADESTIVDQNNSAVGAVGDSIDENSF